MMRESFEPDDFECPLQLIDVKGYDYYFTMCPLTALRQIKVTKTGIYVYTYDCT